jgi:hypothetical protein
MVPFHKQVALLLGFLFTALGLAVAAAAGVGILAGSATDAVVSKSVRTKMFLDGADLGTDGVVVAGFFSLGVDGNGGAFPFSIDSAGSATLDASVCIGTTVGTTADEVTGALVRLTMRFLILSPIFVKQSDLR